MKTERDRGVLEDRVGVEEEEVSSSFHLRRKFELGLFCFFRLLILLTK